MVLKVATYGMVRCTECSMAGFGIVWTRRTHRKPHLRPLLVLNSVQLQLRHLHLQKQATKIDDSRFTNGECNGEGARMKLR